MICTMEQEGGVEGIKLSGLDLASPDVARGRAAESFSFGLDVGRCNEDCNKKSDLPSYQWRTKDVVLCPNKGAGMIAKAWVLHHQAR